MKPTAAPAPTAATAAPRPLSLLAPAWALAGLLGLTACGGQKPDAPAAAAPAPAGNTAAGPAAAPPPPPPPVSVTTVVAAKRDLPVRIAGTGAVTSLSNVEIKPLVTGQVVQVHVKEGDFVKAGQLLFSLDSRADEANVARARAQLARDEAALADAQRQFKRSQELVAQNFVSQTAVDTARTSVQSQEAAVAASKAALESTRVQMSYGRITAPSSGRLGAIPVFKGSVVQANQTTMVTLTQLSPIAVSFALPQRHLGDALAALKNGGAEVTATPPEVVSLPTVAASMPLPAPRGPGAGAPAAPLAPTAAGAGPAPASAGAPQAGPATPALGAGAGPSTPGAPGARPAGPPAVVLKGRVKFVDNTVDPASGTVRVRAVFDNTANKLWPGAFVNVQMTATTLKDAIVIPQAAVVQSQRGTLVYVSQEGKAAPRPIQVLFSQGDDAVVNGLKAGDKVVLDGRQNVRPGSPLVERDPAGKAPAGGGKAGAPGAAPAAPATPAKTGA